MLAISLAGLANIQAGELTAQQEQQMKSEIRELVNEYAVYRDNLDAEQYANTFLENGRLFLRGEWLTGRDVLRIRVENADRNEVTLHVVTTGKIDIIDENTATGVHYSAVYLKSLPEPRSQGQVVPIGGFTVLGKYYDKYQRTDEGWKFAERRMEPVFTTNP